MEHDKKRDKNKHLFLPLFQTIVTDQIFVLEI